MEKDDIEKEVLQFAKMILQITINRYNTLENSEFGRNK